MLRFFPFATLAAAAIFALTLPACSNKDSAPSAPSAPAVSAPAPVAPTASATASPSAAAPLQTSQAEASPQEKLNLYIDCYNQSSSSFGRSLNRYKSWVKDMNVGPTGNERIVYGLYPVSGAQNCKKAIVSANALAPKMPALEQAANTYAASLEPLEDTISEVYTYYDRGNYKDDGFAKGKSLHQSLAGQAKIFTEALQRFSEALDDANDQLQQAQLQRLEKEDGRGVAYYRLSTMIQAKTLVRAFGQDEVNVEKIGAQIDDFEKTVDEMAKAPGDKPMMWDSYTGNVEDFRKAAKALYRRLRDKTPYSTGEKSLLGTSGGWMVEGSPDKLRNTYNTMVDTSNRLR